MSLVIYFNNEFLIIQAQTKTKTNLHELEYGLLVASILKVVSKHVGALKHVPSLQQLDHGILNELCADADVRLFGGRSPSQYHHLLSGNVEQGLLQLG